MSAFEDAWTILSLLVMEDGRRWGDAAAQLQLEDAAAILDPARVQRRHWVGRSRGWSKTTDVGAFTLAAMVSGQLPAGTSAYAAAADREQAGLLRDAIGGFVYRTEELAGALDVQATRVVAKSTGVVLEVLAADAASAYGLRPHWLVLDELCQWPNTRNAREFYEAITTALPKVPTSRAVIITTAGDPAHWSRRPFEAAKAEPSWRVSMTDGPPPWVSPAEVEGERRRLPASAFARLWLNVWSAGEDRLLSRGDVVACVGHAGSLPARPGVSYAIGVDLSRVKDNTVVGVGHVEGCSPDVRVVIDRLDVFKGSQANKISLEAVEECVRARRLAYGPGPVVFDPAHGWQMIERLRRGQLQVVEHTFTPASNSRRALLLLELVREHRLVLPDDDALVDELAALRIRETSPGVYRHDHDAGGHDDRATVVGLIADHLMSLSASSVAENYMDALVASQAGGDLAGGVWRGRLG